MIFNHLKERLTRRLYLSDLIPPTRCSTYPDVNCDPDRSQKLPVTPLSQRPFIQKISPKSVFEAILPAIQNSAQILGLSDPIQMRTMIRNRAIPFVLVAGFRLAYPNISSKFATTQTVSSALIYRQRNSTDRITRLKEEHTTCWRWTCHSGDQLVTGGSRLIVDVAIAVVKAVSVHPAPDRAAIVVDVDTDTVRVGNACVKTPLHTVPVEITACSEGRFISALSPRRYVALCC